jgi:5-methylcytosine-specific restriction protein A
MPTAPLKPCAEPLCGQLVSSARCRKHDLKRRYYATHGRKRITYPGWRKLRALILKRDPFCRDPSGCTSPSTDVDHIIPRRAGGSDDPSNLRGLCHRHHSSKTARLDGRWGRSDFSATADDARRSATFTRALPDWPRGVS